MIKINEQRVSPPTRMAISIRRLIGDVFTLGELQVQLFIADLKDGRKHLTRGVILLAISVSLLLASLPVALFALSYGLAAQFELPMWAGLLISSTAGFVIGGLLLWSAARWLSQSLGFFQRSSQEFSNNLHWMKSGANSNRAERANRSTNGSIK